MKKILIANRGEIAVRILRSIREADMSPVAVYSEADRSALHVRLADEAYCLGPPPSTESYLSIDKIIDVAQRCKASAIHPGYGFLAENAAFAKACEKAGIIFIGPSSKAMSAMGNKMNAREHAKKVGLPMVKASGTLKDVSSARKAADEIGYPVMFKAAAGGGGKGMRRVNKPEELKTLFELAESEALKSFHDKTLYLEQCLVKPRHVEVQIFGDSAGHILSLGNRECSIQRRHQKIIEEAPAPRLSEKTALAMSKAACTLAQAAHYTGAGTVEFLVDSKEQFYFLEMNTRLQVEHPVTEWITRLDLVAWQLQVAFGKKLPLRQEEVFHHGHSIECRLYAEDPENHFLPSPGRITHAQFPSGPGVRVDTSVESGSEVSLYYDPLIAKISVWAEDREKALDRLLRALSETNISGITTNLWFLKEILSHSRFREGRLTTTFIQEEGPFETPLEDSTILDAALGALALESSSRAVRRSSNLESPWWLSGLPKHRLGRRL